MVKVPPQLAIPPLENGDRLNRYEFERRYNAMLNLKKAELIEGVVYMPAALRFMKSWSTSWLGAGMARNLRCDDSRCVIGR